MLYSETVKERAEQIITEVIEPMGYELVDVTYTTGKEKVLTAFIYKKGGVTLDDCVAVNDALEAPLELNDITDGKPYTLNISSPGLDRPVVTDRDIKRSMGEILEAVLIKPIGKAKKIIGALSDWNDDEIKLSSEKGETTIPRADIKVLRPFVDLKSAGRVKFDADNDDNTETKTNA